ncbi:MAG: hypothetical protein ACI3ZD_09840, partial [Prevotella sp.]
TPSRNLPSLSKNDLRSKKFRGFGLTGNTSCSQLFSLLLKAKSFHELIHSYDIECRKREFHISVFISFTTKTPSKTPQKHQAKHHKNTKSFG